MGYGIPRKSMGACVPEIHLTGRRRGHYPNALLMHQGIIHTLVIAPTKEAVGIRLAHVLVVIRITVVVIRLTVVVIRIAVGIRLAQWQSHLQNGNKTTKMHQEYQARMITTDSGI